MSLYVPNVDELIALGRKTSHPSRKTRLTRAAIEATLLSQSGEHELELANFSALSAILSELHRKPWIWSPTRP